MKITVNNIDRPLRVELSKLFSIVGIDDNPDGVFIEWSTKGKEFDKQTKILDKCLKSKIPVIVFDRYQNISPEEASFLMKEGVFLWEPAVAGRMFFSFQPVWGYIKTEAKDIDSFTEKRPIDFGYASSLVRKLPSFKKYFLPVHETGEFNVTYIETLKNDTIYQKVDEMGIIMTDQAKITDISVTLLIGSEHDYETGYLDHNLFMYLENGVIPLLPKEHRWYHSVFGDLVVDNNKDIEYILLLNDKISFGCIYDIYNNLDKYLPEANVKNVAKRIFNYFS